MLTSFRHPAYRWLWVSNFSASAGRWALVLVLSSQLLALTHSSFWVGLGLFLTQGPVIFLAPYSGALADRFDRRTLNVLSVGLSALTTGLFAVLTALGLMTLATMLVLSLLFGFSFVFQVTLRNTLVPSLVPPERLLNAVSLFQVGTQGAQFAGPALATPVLVAGGPAAAWALCALLYALSAGLSVLVGEARPAPSQAAGGGRLAAAFGYLRARPLALAAVFAVALHCSLTMAYQGMLPMFATMDLRTGDSGYGTLLTSIGLGAVLGSLTLARFSTPRRQPLMLLASLAGSGLGLAAMGAAGTVPAAAAAGFAAGATQAIFMSMALALIQSSVDDEFRGRATSFYQVITMAPMAAVGWGMGGLADVTEPRPLMIAGGLLFLVAMAVYAAFSPWLRRLFSADAWQARPATRVSVEIASIPASGAP